LGFTICATRGTAKALERAQIQADVLNKVGEGSPHVVDEIRSHNVVLVVNTTQGAKEVRDSYSLRRQTLLANIPYFTTMSAALAMVQTLEEESDPQVRSLQEWHGRGI
jgi:carbamoyl-phosphate synthase large subunit